MKNHKDQAWIFGHYFQIELENSAGIFFKIKVEGCKESSKMLLCLKWVQSGFYMAFLFEQQTAGQISRVFRSLQKTMGPERFRQLFPVILTGRGPEFTNPKAI